MFYGNQSNSKGVLGGVALSYDGWSSDYAKLASSNSSKIRIRGQCSITGLASAHILAEHGFIKYK